MKKKSERDLILSAGFKDGTRKISISITGEEYSQATNEAIGMAVSSIVAQLKDLEIEAQKKHE